MDFSICCFSYIVQWKQKNHRTEDWTLNEIETNADIDDMRMLL